MPECAGGMCAKMAVMNVSGSWPTRHHLHLPCTAVQHCRQRVRPSVESGRAARAGVTDRNAVKERSESGWWIHGSRN